MQFTNRKNDLNPVLMNDTFKCIMVNCYQELGKGRIRIFFFIINDSS